MKGGGGRDSNWPPPSVQGRAERRAERKAEGHVKCAMEKNESSEGVGPLKDAGFGTSLPQLCLPLLPQMNLPQRVPQSYRTHRALR